MPAGRPSEYDPKFENGNSCDLLYKSDDYSYWNVPWVDTDGVIGDVAIMSRKVIRIANNSKSNQIVSLVSNG